jgi:hypothetical protein
LPSAIHVRKSSIYFADDAELGYCQRRRQNVPNGGEILYQSG